MLEKYYKYKLQYKEFIILIRSGNFYETIDNDSFIMNKLFNYKLTRLSNTLKCGFPINFLATVSDYLAEKHVSYVVVDGDSFEVFESEKNEYDNYKIDLDIIKYNTLRLEKITKLLNGLVYDKSSSSLLDSIEDLINERQTSNHN